MAEMTPMRQQYLQIKERNPDCLLFFRLGDFYEMFDEDARIASKELDLTLTTRDRTKEDPNGPKIPKTPMCGVPYHSSEAYIARLIARGYKVAICDQLEDPKAAKGLVKRDVTRIVTPGAVTESSMLREGLNNYYACVYEEDRVFGVSFCDISTGAFLATYFEGENAEKAVCNELGAFSPAEILLGGEALSAKHIENVLKNRLTCCVNRGEDAQFALEPCEKALVAQFGKTMKDLSLTDTPIVIQSAGALIMQLIAAQKGALPHVREFEFYLSGKYMGLDLAARRNLELTETLRSKEKRGSLLAVMDKTKTAMGGRLLRSWIERPLLSPTQIGKRLDAVEEFTKNTYVREEISVSLRDISDLERVISRVVTGTCNCRDLVSLSQGSQALPEIKNYLTACKTPLLKTLCAEIDTLDDVRALISRAIVPEPPFTLHDGGLILTGYNEELDRLRQIQRDGKGTLAAIEAQEKEKTGIRNLRIGYNRVFGYYIEVAKGQLDLVPDSYIRKQTLSTGERYITQELKELETTILTAKDRIVELEYELFDALREKICAEAPRIQKTARAIAQADVLSGFATIAVYQHYCKPEVDLSGAIDITDGRHPVVEQMLEDSLFMPNDTHLSPAATRCAIITGPNMAGKSTYMRQIALISIMAQMGSFVPAKSAHLGIIDNIFTRIGASDDLSSGQSTFMVEMKEVADILQNATPNSLLILDEIGRGTSTYDGMAIARAVLEYAASRTRLGAKTLFATHYHELSAIEAEITGVKNFNIAVKKRGGDMIFLRKIVPGAADESYGVEVAKLAGIPEKVIVRARALLKELQDTAPQRTPAASVQPEQEQVCLADLGSEKLKQAVEEINLDTLTPIEALNALYQLKKLL